MEDFNTFLLKDEIIASFSDEPLNLCLLFNGTLSDLGVKH